MRALGKPLVIGIAGGTGSGKSTIARHIVAHFRDEHVGLIQHDSYYRDRPQLSDAERAGVNYDHPDSLENSLLVAHIDELLASRAVEVPIYDFVTHRRQTHTTALTKRPILIVEGILLFDDPRLRERFDIKLYVDTPADIRVLRRIRRDMQLRGRSFEDTRQQYYATVRPMHEAFVEPSRRHADLIIPEGGSNRVAIGVIVDKVHRELQRRQRSAARRRRVRSGAARRRKAAPATD